MAAMAASKASFLSLHRSPNPLYSSSSPSSSSSSSSSSSFGTFPRRFPSLSSSSSSSSPSSPLSVLASKNKRSSSSSSNADGKNSPPAKGFSKKSQKNTKNDPWESLLQQLETDLENDNEEVDDDEDITEEDILSFEQELQSVVKDLAAEVRRKRGKSKEVAEEMKARNVDEEDENSMNWDGDHDEDMSDDEFEEPRKVHLERWQLKKLAAASEIGRRKVNIKSLAAELQLERDDVISFLKNPPTELLLMLANEAEDEASANEEEEHSDNEEEASDDVTSTDEEQSNQLLGDVESGISQSDKFNRLEYGPRDWIKGKRLRKVHIATMERVYKRTKWPTNAMIESIVNVTRLPRRRVLDWFDERRQQSGSKNPHEQPAILRKTWKKTVTHSFAHLTEQRSTE